MKRHWLLLGALGLGAVAFAANDGVLYVRAKNTRLLATPTPTANAIATLQPGEPVKYGGADPKSPRWHKVVAGGKTGYVFQTNLTTQKPKEEIRAQGAVQVSTSGKASKGAAVKALGGGAISFGQAEPEKKSVVDQLQAVDAIANRVTGKQLAAHTRSNGLTVATGGDQ